MKNFMLIIVTIMGIFLISCSDNSTGSDNGGSTNYNVDVSITPSGAGIILPSTHKNYDEGDAIELQAKASESYIFSYWSGDMDSTSDNPLELKAEQDFSLTAHFQKKEKDSYSVDVSVVPSEAGMISPSAHETYAEGDAIELQAKASESYIFSYWSGDVDSTSDNPLELMAEQDFSLTAHFKKEEKESPFYLANNGVTIKCDEAELGDAGTVNGVTYTKRDVEDITTQNAETTCTSGITSMVNMFTGVSDFNGDLSSWDVSNVTRMDFMFREATSINVDLSSWDVSNVTNMKGMFSKTNASTVIGDISNWDVSSVTNMNAMFAQNGDFNQDISNWNVSSVTIITAMFLNASSFNADLSSWDVGNVTTMEQTFRGASSFDVDLSSWDVSNVTTMKNMFRDASSFNADIGDWDVSNVTNMKVMFANASVFDQDISDWCVSNIPSEPTSFALHTPIDDSPDKKPVWGTCPNN